MRRAILHVYLDGYRKRRRWSVLAPAGRGTHVRTRRPDVTAVRRPTSAPPWRRSPPQQRAAVVLHHVDDLSVREVADSMGVAEGTVKRYLYDARQKLGSLLAHDDGDRIDVTTVRRTR